MFEFFKGKFDAGKHLTIHCYDDRGAELSAIAPRSTVARVATRGLSKRKRPELELVSVPSHSIRLAASLLNLVAEYTVNVSRIENGQRFGQVLQHLLVGVRAFEVELSGGERALRLHDLDDSTTGPQPPFLALATLAVLEGLVRAEEDTEAALECFATSVALLPGIESDAPVRQHEDGLVNDQNFLGYLGIARYDEALAEHAYQSALARSSNLRLMEYGKPGTVDGPHVVLGLIRRLLEADELIATKLAQAANMGMTLCPIVEATPEGNVQRLLLLKPGLRACFFEEPVRTQLQHPNTVELVMELIRAFEREPYRAMASTLDTRNAYLDPLGPATLFEERNEPTRPLGDDDPSLPMVSRIVVDVGRRLAAGLSLDEIRAGCGLLDDAHHDNAFLEDLIQQLSDSAGQRMQAWRVRELQGLLEFMANER